VANYLQEARNFATMAFADRIKLEFLARCRLQPDGVTIHFYPNFQVDMKEYSKLRAKRKKRNE
jgi:hypothetical protein